MARATIDQIAASYTRPSLTQGQFSYENVISNEQQFQDEKELIITNQTQDIILPNQTVDNPFRPQRPTIEKPQATIDEIAAGYSAPVIGDESQLGSPIVMPGEFRTGDISFTRIVGVVVILYSLNYLSKNWK